MSDSGRFGLGRFTGDKSILKQESQGVVEQGTQDGVGKGLKQAHLEGG